MPPYPKRAGKNGSLSERPTCDPGEPLLRSVPLGGEALRPLASSLFFRMKDSSSFRNEGFPFPTFVSDPRCFDFCCGARPKGSIEFLSVARQATLLNLLEPRRLAPTNWVKSRPLETVLQGRTSGEVRDSPRTLPSFFGAASSRRRMRRPGHDQLDKSTPRKRPLS